MKGKILIVVLLLIAAVSTAIGASEVVNLKDISSLKLTASGNIPVEIQDQSTRPFAIRVNQILNNNITLAVSPTVNTYQILLESGHGIVAGDDLAMIEQNGEPQLYFSNVESVLGNVITLKTIIPFPFVPNKTQIFTFENEMNVDGSGLPEIYSITNFFNDAVDVTRVIFHCTDATSMDDEKFCGTTELDRGIVLRKKRIDGTYINYWNIRNNGEWGELAFDKSYDEKAPAGLYGFTSRLTYNGQSKHGVVIRLETGESIELVVQDDLTVLDHMVLMVEGHFTQN